MTVSHFIEGLRSVFVHLKPVEEVDLLKLVPSTSFRHVVVGEVSSYFSVLFSHSFGLISQLVDYAHHEVEREFNDVSISREESVRTVSFELGSLCHKHRCQYWELSVFHHRDEFPVILPGFAGSGDHNFIVEFWVGFKGFLRITMLSGEIKQFFIENFFVNLRIHLREEVTFLKVIVNFHRISLLLFPKLRIKQGGVIISECVNKALYSPSFYNHRVILLLVNLLGLLETVSDPLLVNGRVAIIIEVVHLSRLNNQPLDVFE